MPAVGCAGLDYVRKLQDCQPELGKAHSDLILRVNTHQHYGH